jgi:hypothetical protein
VIAEKIYVINKVVRVGVDAVVAIGHSLRRELPDQMVIPKYVRIRGLTANRELRGFATQRRRAYALTA